MKGRWLTPDAPSPGYICRLIKIPNSVDFHAIVNGALDDLQRVGNFEQYGALTPQETADLFAQMYDDYRQNRGCMIGTVFAHCRASAPDGSLVCDGATHLKADYPALYDVLDSVYHVDADHFKVPDLRGRVPIGTGQGVGLTNRILDTFGGSETHILVQGEMPSHTHTYNWISTVPGVVQTGTPLAAIVGNSGNVSGSAGSDNAHQNMPPYRGLNFAIWAV